MRLCVVLFVFLVIHIKCSLSATISAGCTDPERQIIIDALRRVADWSHLALQAMHSRAPHRIDPLGIFELFFGGNNEHLRQPVRNRFAAVKWEAERSPGGTWERGQSRILIRCHHILDATCEVEEDVMDVDGLRNEIHLVLRFVSSLRPRHPNNADLVPPILHLPTSA